MFLLYSLTPCNTRVIALHRCYGGTMAVKLELFSKMEHRLFEKTSKIPYKTILTFVL